MKASYLSASAVFFLTLLWIAQSAAQGQSLPSAEDFNNALKACNTAQNINLNSSIVDSLGKLYSNEISRQALRSPAEFLLLIPEDKRIDAYRLYAECIAKIAPQVTAGTTTTSPTLTTTYRICTGEYERACQTHDVYMYCYESPENWAKNRCSNYSVRQLNSYGGNKCGYSLYEVLCNGPK
jgi:hypothetical protein